jgi:hypothetical protein
MKRKYCFQKYIINLWWQHSHTVSQIGNADQTLVYSEIPLDTTVHTKGDKMSQEELAAMKNSDVQ